MGPFFLISSAFRVAERPSAPCDRQHLANLAVYAFAAMALLQLLWIVSVTRLGVGTAPLHVNLTPLYVMAILFLLGTDWNGLQAVGAVIVTVRVIPAQIKWPATRI